MSKSLGSLQAQKDTDIANFWLPGEGAKPAGNFPPNKETNN